MSVEEKLLNQIHHLKDRLDAQPWTPSPEPEFPLRAKILKQGRELLAIGLPRVEREFKEAFLQHCRNSIQTEPFEIRRGPDHLLELSKDLQDRREAERKL